jgi:hypothetical protein
MERRDDGSLVAGNHCSVAELLQAITTCADTVEVIDGLDRMDAAGSTMLEQAARIAAQHRVAWSRVGKDGAPAVAPTEPDIVPSVAPADAARHRLRWLTGRRPRPSHDLSIAGSTG